MRIITTLIITSALILNTSSLFGSDNNGPLKKEITVGAFLATHSIEGIVHVILDSSATFNENTNHTVSYTYKDVEAKLNVDYVQISQEKIEQDKMCDLQCGTNYSAQYYDFPIWLNFRVNYETQGSTRNLTVKIPRDIAISKLEYGKHYSFNINEERGDILRRGIFSFTIDSDENGEFSITGRFISDEETKGSEELKPMFVSDNDYIFNGTFIVPPEKEDPQKEIERLKEKLKNLKPAPGGCPTDIIWL